MRVPFSLAVVYLLCLIISSARADKIGPPESYRTLSADKKFVFVMLADQPGNVANDTAIRDTYKKSGLYKNDGSNEPLWTVDWYARSVAVASDGVHVVRYGGLPIYAEHLNKDRTQRMVTAADLKNEALSVFAKGKLLKEFTIGDFVDDPKALSRGATFFMWRKQTKFIDDKLQLELMTHDGNRVLIDLATAKVLEKKRAE